MEKKQYFNPMSTESQLVSFVDDRPDRLMTRKLVSFHNCSEPDDANDSGECSNHNYDSQCSLNHKTISTKSKLRCSTSLRIPHRRFVDLIDIGLFHRLFATRSSGRILIFCLSTEKRLKLRNSVYSISLESEAAHPLFVKLDALPNNFTFSCSGIC